MICLSVCLSIRLFVHSNLIKILIKTVQVIQCEQTDGQTMANSIVSLSHFVREGDKKILSQQDNVHLYCSEVNGYWLRSEHCELR